MSFLLVLTCVPGDSTGTMREIASPLAVDGSTMKALPPFERFAARTKSDCPPVPEYGSEPRLSEPHWPSRSICSVALIATSLSLRPASAGSLVMSTGCISSAGLRSMNRYSLAEPSAKVASTLPGWWFLRRLVTAPHSISDRMPSPIISVWMPRSCLPDNCITTASGMPP